MVHKLNSSSHDFSTKFEEFLQLRDEYEADISSTVREIIATVRSDGDTALFVLTEKFDRLKLTPEKMRITKTDLAKARKACGRKTLSALKHAAQRIRSYHKKQLPKNVEYRDRSGVLLGWRWTPIDAVGLYVPGGTASYPSSVLMNAIPAQVAGVKRLAMVVPTPDGKVNPAVLAAAEIAGIEEIYPIGGAQAVAALAYGTKSIKPVDKIVGPGNAFVAEAKRQVFGKVGIDMIAGPSEILVVADSTNDPDWIAADLLSQAEHDKKAQSILITDDEIFAAKVQKAVDTTLGQLARYEIASSSWRNYGAIIIVKNLIEAAQLANRIAPEHLELAVKDAEKLSRQITHAGAIFLGNRTPEAIGDYIAGPSHVLPTSGTARFSSGLSIYDFMKRSSLISCSQAAIKKIGKDASTLAHSEGLGAHELSITLRL